MKQKMKLNQSQINMDLNSAKMHVGPNSEILTTIRGDLWLKLG